jgi:uncharacterized protein YjiS (DUF1127 family)
MTQTVALSALASRSHSVLGRLYSALMVYRSRRDLARLDAHMLNDIGLTARQAEDEAARPVWDVPHTWRQ